MEVDPRAGEGQARGERVGDHVDLVSRLGKRHRQLGRDDPRAAVGRVAADADLQRTPPGRIENRSPTAIGSGLQNGSPNVAPIRLPKWRARPSIAKKKSGLETLVSGP